MEAYNVRHQYQKLSKHGVTSIDLFAALIINCEEDELGINNFNVQFRALPKAQTLLNSMWQRDAIKQGLLVSNISRFARNLTHWKFCKGFQNRCRFFQQLCFLERKIIQLTSYILSNSLASHGLGGRSMTDYTTKIIETSPNCLHAHSALLDLPSIYNVPICLYV